MPVRLWAPSGVVGESYPSHSPPPAPPPDTALPTEGSHQESGAGLGQKTRVCLTSTVMLAWCPRAPGTCDASMVSEDEGHRSPAEPEWGSGMGSREAPHHEAWAPGGGWALGCRGLSARASSRLVLLSLESFEVFLIPQLNPILRPSPHSSNSSEGPCQPPSICFSFATQAGPSLRASGLPAHSCCPCFSGLLLSI